MGSFHAGEIALQAEAGVQARMAEVGARFIRDRMPEQHREFFAQLPLVVIGSLDADGQPWASLLAGPPGFAHSPDPQRLRIETRWRGVANGAAVGLLGIEPHTRRRNRMNGIVVAAGDEGFEIAVQQSFGNCPKYIQPRQAVFDAAAAKPGLPTVEMSVLEGEALRIVREADTFFIATSHPQAGTGDAAQGVDVSHRGGPRGFIEVGEAGAVLSVPDFVGNSYFNTLGNLVLQPRCGLVFIDHASGAVVQVAASGEVVRGDQRRLILRVEKVRLTPHALPLRWT